MPAHTSGFFFRGALLRLALGLAAWVLVAGAAAPARAATYTVTSTGDGTGNGTLRRAVANANTNAGADTINFSIVTGALTGGVAVFNLAAGPLVFTDAGTVLNGASQTTNRGNTNPGTLGVGGTVGVDALTLAPVDRPEVMFVDAGGLAIGIDIQAPNITIRGIAIYGFGTTANDDANANIRVGTVAGTVIEDCVLGTTATSFSDPGAARSVGDNIRVNAGTSGAIRDNVIGYSNGKGIQLGNGANNWAVTGNEVRGNGINNANLDGIDVENGSGNNIIRGNRFWENEAPGVDMYHSTGGNLIENNTITRNGIGTGAIVETPGVRLYGNGNLVDRNVITANFGAGVMVTTAAGNATGNRITRNSIYDNGTITNKGGGGPSNQIGIDLQAAGQAETVGTSPFVTPNDSLDADAGGNSLLNFPVLATAVISGTNLTLSGFSRPGAQLEFFVATADPTGFGEGRTYLVTLQEGTAADADATTSSYASPFGGLNVGSDTNANRFKFTLAVPAGVGAGTRLTATATLAATASTFNTSEFSNNVVAALAPNVELRKCVNWGAQCIETALNNVPPGSDLTYTITIRNLVAAGGLSASGVTVVDIVPPGTQFKVGSMAFSPNTTTLGGASMQVTNVSLPNPVPSQPPLPPPDNDPSWGYTPAGTYDPAVKFVRWRFLSGSVASGASGTVAFTVRVP